MAARLRPTIVKTRSFSTGPPWLLEVVDGQAHVLQGHALAVVTPEGVGVRWVAVEDPVGGLEALRHDEAVRRRLDDQRAAPAVLAGVRGRVEPATGPLCDLRRVVVHAAPGELGAALLGGGGEKE